jgi:hypothetical protein
VDLAGFGDAEISGAQVIVLRVDSVDARTLDDEMELMMFMQMRQKLSSRSAKCPAYPEITEFHGSAVVQERLGGYHPGLAQRTPSTHAVTSYVR